MIVQVILRNGEVKSLIDILPHGSGFNGTWCIHDDGNWIKCSNRYDLMDDNGMDDGELNFTVWFNRHTFASSWHASFRLEVAGDYDKVLYNEEYIDYTLYETLELAQLDCLLNAEDIANE